MGWRAFGAAHAGGRKSHLQIRFVPIAFLLMDDSGILAQPAASKKTHPNARGTSDVLLFQAALPAFDECFEYEAQRSPELPKACHSLAVWDNEGTTREARVARSWSVAVVHLEALS